MLPVALLDLGLSGIDSHVMVMRRDVTLGDSKKEEVVQTHSHIDTHPLTQPILTQLHF